MSKKILPIDTNPMMRGYLHQAFIFSIMQTESERTLPWIFNNYIQTVFRADYDAQFDIFASWEMLNSVFWWKQFTLDVLEDAGGSFSNFVKHTVDRDFYVYCFADQFYIPNRPLFGKMHMIHDELIFGFDDEAKTFDILAFNSTGDYRATKVTYEQIDKSAPPYIGYLQINHDTPMRLDPTLISATIRDYLDPSLSKNRCNMWRDLNPDDRYGIDASRELTKLYKKQLSGELPMDIRSAHLLFEHKALMLKRIDYLLKNGAMSESHLKDEFSKITDKAASMRRAYLRAFISEDKEKLSKVITLNEEILSDEKRVLTLVADDIDKTCLLSKGGRND